TQALIPLLKTPGRFYIWLYPKRGRFYSLLLNSVRFFTSRMPKHLLLLLLKKAVPLFRLWKRLKRENYYTRIAPDDEIINLFDCYSPRYQHRHHPAELQQWFSEMGFGRIDILHYNKYNLDALALK
ncbi:unnamed protein product, partial [marine sediment metagenome]